MQKLTPLQATERIRHYCAYQERCHSEVRKKLFDLGLSAADAELIITGLIADNFLNEERFAVHFSTGKFRMKKWGKQKIASELKRRQVSDYCIKKGLSSIDEEAYRKTFRQLADEKKKSLSGEKNIFIKKSKISNFLIAKGYAADMIYSYLSDL